MCPKKHTLLRAFSPRGPVSSVDPWYRFHPLFFKYYWYKGILSQNRRTFNRQCIKLHARAPHRKSAQMPTHEAFVHPFRLPTGARKGHISIFAVLLHSKNRTTPRGRSQSIGKPRRVSRPQTRKMLIRFLPRPVRGRKHFARSERRIVRCQRTTEAQSAANSFSKKWLCHFFDRERPRGSFSVSL